MGDRNDRGGDTDEHRVLIRQVIRQFEELTSMGSDALPAIDRFLDQGLDLVLWETPRKSPPAIGSAERFSLIRFSPVLTNRPFQFRPAYRQTQWCGPARM